MQALLDRKPSHVTLVHAGGEELRLIAAELFRAIHRAVRRLEQRFDILSVGREEADADAGGHEQLMSVHMKWFRQRGENFSRDAEDRVGAAGVVEQDREFVAAEALDRVGGANGTLQPRGNLGQQAIADRMSQPVVDQFEMI